MAATTEPDTGIVCSFCLKPTSEVAKMVAGPGVFICNECIALCGEIIAQEAAGEPAGKSAEKPAHTHWERQLSDDDLLATLPKIAAAGGQVERHLARWVTEARSRGITWTRIGAALGMTRQSAWERFSGEE
ncbi:MAG TPA: ClpX C4-type zinc finger protein [Streptosporangiaceae bacterium]|nr:ClpX C4-type zinc finger protein [Streptosporangiaceae bacterium]